MYDEEAKLFNFSVKLTQAGHVAVEHECLKPEEFKEVIDKWNDQYQNTEVIVALLTTCPIIPYSLKETYIKYYVKSN